MTHNMTFQALSQRHPTENGWEMCTGNRFTGDMEGTRHVVVPHACEPQQLTAAIALGPSATLWLRARPAVAGRLGGAGGCCCFLMAIPMVSRLWLRPRITRWREGQQEDRYKHIHRHTEGHHEVHHKTLVRRADRGNQHPQHTHYFTNSRQRIVAGLAGHRTHSSQPLAYILLKSKRFPPSLLPFFFKQHISLI